MANLNEPLFHHPTKNDRTTMLNQKICDNRYLPPYRYDSNETTFNMYLTSSEAYSTVAKTLLFEYEMHKDEFSPYDIVIKTLAISQIKMFADAHMEKALSLPTFPEPSEPSDLSLVRRIDLYFKDVLLEYYASKDGILLGPQIQELSRRHLEQKGSTNQRQQHDNESKQVSFPAVEKNKVVTAGMRNNLEESPPSKPTEPVFSIENNESRNSKSGRSANSVQHGGSSSVEKKNDSKQHQYQTSFERIYNADDEEERSNDNTPHRYIVDYEGENSIKNEESRDDNDFNHSITSKSRKDMRENYNRSSTSKLRQEILQEISQLKGLIQNTSSDLEKKRYKTHLNSLVNELDTYHNIHPMQEVRNPSETAMERNIHIVDSLDSTEVVSVSKTRNFSQIEVTTPRDSRIMSGITDMSEEDDDMNSWGYIHMNGPNRDVSRLSFDENSKVIQSRGFIHINDVEKGFRFVSLIAHENLRDGSLFQAKYRHHYFTVRVPKGGVKKGQVFTSPMLHPSGKKGRVVKYESLLDGMEIPHGGWRDKIFSCCSDPMFLISCFCPNAALSQVRTRVKYQDTGEVTDSRRVKNVLAYNILVIMLNVWTFVALSYAVNDADPWALIACLVPLGVVDLFLISRLVMLTLKTRREVKERYDIEEDRCHGRAEALLVTFCSCCVISQMGRHTADYSTFREVPLSATGLPSQLETLVPLTPKRSFRQEKDSGSVHSC